MNIQPKNPMKGAAPGEARSEGPTVQEILDQDSKPVPGVLRQVDYHFLGDEDIAADRYFSRDFHELEYEHVWKKVWQMVCREEDIPDVGDYIEYKIVRSNLIIVRTEDGIKALHNSCLHRGRKLVDGDGAASQFRCAYHGWTWDITGALKEIPCKWDFPHINAQNGKLPEAKVGTWGGFVYINMDPDSISLDEYLGDLPQHFERWDFENRYKAVHVAKVMPANWKICLEAFTESYHVIDTHPQIMPHTADANTQYDIYDDAHFNRMITPMGVVSPHLAGEAVTEQDIVAAMMNTATKSTPEDVPELPEGITARQFMAENSRQYLAAKNGVSYEAACDSEMLDAIEYFIFPNMHPWGGHSPNIVYRFRPNGDDPESALVEIMFLDRFDPAQGRPPAAQIHVMTDDQIWADADELEGLGPVFDQDMANIPHMVDGLKASAKGAVSFGNYQEARLRHFHQLIDRYIAAGQQRLEAMAAE